MIVSAACSARREHTLRPSECAFVVYNRTPHALEVRLGSSLSSAPIGAINQGELLNHAAPCEQRWVWIYGVPIPERVGAPVRFAYVVGAAELKAGTRPGVELTWP